MDIFLLMALFSILAISEPHTTQMNISRASKKKSSSGWLSNLFGYSTNESKEEEKTNPLGWEKSDMFN